VELRPLLRSLQTLETLPDLLAALGHQRLFDRVPDLFGPRRARGSAAVFAVGRAGDFPWFAVASPHAERSARSLARRLVGRGRIAGVLALDSAGRRLSVAVTLDGIPSLSIDLDHPAPTALACLGRLGGNESGGVLAYALRVADALSGESAGRRFFQTFSTTLEQMAAGLPGPLRSEDRRSLALLQLTRVLFLYFVQAKGWLAGRDRFLAEEVDRCLTRKRSIHRDLLQPLFFGTLNRPAPERGSRAARFGAIPFLNGGLFEPHPLERCVRGAIPTPLWRDAFDQLFERFHFTVSESPGQGIAPDMLGRVFEGVMAPDLRRASGTFYTPAALVRGMLDAALPVVLAGRLNCGENEARHRLDDGDPAALAALGSLTVLDPAVGSGAFLLGALERLSELEGGKPESLAKRRRRILEHNLFGVDLSAAAVRLTELRLWLAVIAGETSDRPELVKPLPNLDCLIRQGDSLLEPLGGGLRLRPAGRDSANAIAVLRRRVVGATGVEKRTLVRKLRDAEAAACAESLAAAERELAEAVTECLREARGGDLFGERRGLDRALGARLQCCRAELRAVRSARRGVLREREVPWFHYQTHFADVFASDGFDLVVGNPPWLRSEEVPQAVRRRLAGRYRWWRSGGGYGNHPDLAVAFLERAVELARPGGAIALLVPAKLATAGYGSAARHALATTTTLSRVADLTDHPDAAFDATVYPLAVVARKAPPPSGHRVHTQLGREAGPGVAQSRLQSGGPWILRSGGARAAVARLERQHPLLGDQIACHLGVKTGANALFLDPPRNIEPEVLRWAIRGRDVRAFRINLCVRLLWTHGPDGRPLKELPPRAAEHLLPRLASLRARADYQGERPWTLFRVRAATAPHRVVWADLGRRLAASALVGARDADRLPINSCYVAPTSTAAEAERLAAWLNCSWIRATALLRAVPAAGGFRRYSAATVSGLPLPASVLSDSSLSGLARAGRRGEPVQEHLDDLAARHLGLSAGERTALGRLVAACADHRRRGAGGGA
jgi:hypothetical protein